MNKSKVINNEDIYKVKTKDTFRKTSRKSPLKKCLLPETWIKHGS